jgi:hypothetical protein
MKRKIEQKPKRIRPWLIWKQCDNCGIEFRREFGWSMLTPPIRMRSHGSEWTTRYLCNSCAPTESEAIKYMDGGYMGKCPESRPKRQPEPVVRPTNLVI